jgi:hypothetical protein
MACSGTALLLNIFLYFVLLQYFFTYCTCYLFIYPLVLLTDLYLLFIYIILETRVKLDVDCNDYYISVPSHCHTANTFNASLLYVSHFISNYKFKETQNRKKVFTVTYKEDTMFLVSLLQI